MLQVKLSRSEREVYHNDLDRLEAHLSARLPSSFKQFFLANNGGVSDRDWWDSGDDYDPVRVKRFKAIAPSGVADELETKYIGGCYLAMTGRQVIPVTILPFAIDDGGNFFCLDLVEGCVCFFAVDGFDPNLSAAENHVRAYRWLTSSFELFVSGLKDESEVDL